jgi:hypothetical protein
LSATELPSFLAEQFPSATRFELPEGSTSPAGGGSAAGQPAREWASWAAADFEAACAALLEGGADDDLGLLPHAVLVGLARGASRETFAYAERRQVAGRTLIQLDLMALRLSEVATHELVSELQFGRMCEAATVAGAEDDLVSAQAEIRRAGLKTVIEGAQVWGGHGFLQRESPGRRVEAAEAIVLALRSRRGWPDA